MRAQDTRPGGRHCMRERSGPEPASPKGGRPKAGHAAETSGPATCPLAERLTLDQLAAMVKFRVHLPSGGLVS